MEFKEYWIGVLDLISRKILRSITIMVTAILVCTVVISVHNIRDEEYQLACSVFDNVHNGDLSLKTKCIPVEIINATTMLSAFVDSDKAHDVLSAYTDTDINNNMALRYINYLDKFRHKDKSYKYSREEVDEIVSFTREYTEFLNRYSIIMGIYNIISAVVDFAWFFTIIGLYSVVLINIRKYMEIREYRKGIQVQ